MGAIRTRRERVSAKIKPYLIDSSGVHGSEKKDHDGLSRLLLSEEQ